MPKYIHKQALSSPSRRPRYTSVVRLVPATTSPFCPPLTSDMHTNGIPLNPLLMNSMLAFNKGNCSWVLTLSQLTICLL